MSVSFPKLSRAAWRVLRDHIAPNPPGVLDDTRATLAWLDDALDTPMIDRIGSIA